MKVKYYPETDTFYIEVKDIPDIPSVESEEIIEGIVLDYDEKGNIVGIEIEGVKKIRDLNLPIEARFELSKGLSI